MVTNHNEKYFKNNCFYNHFSGFLLENHSYLMLKINIHYKMQQLIGNNKTSKHVHTHTYTHVCQGTVFLIKHRWVSGKQEMTA